MGLGDLQGKSCTLLVHIITQKNTIGHLVGYKGVSLSMAIFFCFVFKSQGNFLDPVWKQLLDTLKHILYINLTVHVI